MNTKQFTVTEKNEWEGETFAYVLQITPYLAEMIQEKITEHQRDDLTIEETDWTPTMVDTVNKVTDNSYMDRVNFYELKEATTIGNWEDPHGLFFKGGGLERIKSTKP